MYARAPEPLGVEDKMTDSYLAVGFFYVYHSSNPVTNTCTINSLTHYYSRWLID
jgi:hypothetical protein